MLTKEEVLKIADLARIYLTDEEVENLQKDLSVILGYVEELKKVNVDGIEPTYQVTGLTNVFRPDKPIMAENRDEITANAPEIKDGYYKVKAIL